MASKARRPGGSSFLSLRFMGSALLNASSRSPHEVILDFGWLGHVLLHEVDKLAGPCHTPPSCFRISKLECSLTRDVLSQRITAANLKRDDVYVGVYRTEAVVHHRFHIAYTWGVQEL